MKTPRQNNRNSNFSYVSEPLLQLSGQFMCACMRDIPAPTTTNPHPPLVQHSANKLLELLVVL